MSVIGCNQIMLTLLLKKYTGFVICYECQLKTDHHCQCHKTTQRNFKPNNCIGNTSTQRTIFKLRSGSVIQRLPVDKINNLAQKPITKDKKLVCVKSYCKMRVRATPTKVNEPDDKNSPKELL